MKRILFPLLISIFCSLSLSAQWVQLNSGITDKLSHVYFTDNNTGYAAGGDNSNRQLLKTTNGGTSWVSLLSNLQYEIISLNFASPNVGFYTSGIDLYRTDDAGLNWNNISNFGVGGTKIFFINPDTGFAANNSALFRTINGGLSWSIININNFPVPEAIHFPTPQIGYIVNYDGEVLKTTDMGATWVIVKQTFFRFTDVFFTDGNTGYVVGDDWMGNIILKTQDGGLNWTSKSIASNNLNLSYSVYFTDQNTGYFSSSSIYKTTDSGINWNLMSAPSSVNDIYFPSSGVGYAVGNNGKILKLNAITGLETDILTKSGIKVFPNPSLGIINLEFEKSFNLKGMNLELSNLLGQKIFLAPIQAHNSKFDLSKFKGKGIYFVKILDSKNNLIESRKIVLQ